jgi:predicted metalloprotease with PDZ domain
MKGQRMFHLRSSAIAAATAAVLSASLCSAASADAPRISYELAMPMPANHTYDVTLRVSGLDRSRTTVAMPIWIPGYYSDDHYARNVSRLEAYDGAGRRLAWHQDGDSAWAIETAGVRELVVRYKLYADRHGDVGTQLAEQRAEFQGAETFAFVENGDGRPVPGPVTLRVTRPAGWAIASGLVAMQTAADTYTAPSYDVLVDCPTIVSPRLATAEFSVDGKAYHLAVDGPGTFRIGDLAAVARQIVASEVRMMGHAGYSQYWILFQTLAGGGMEHLNSTISGMNANGWERKHDPAAEEEDVPMREFALVLAHEHFHSWNVKRIRPRVLGPFDYLHEVHTRRLDVAEGLTEYYTYIHLMRSGFDQPKPVYKDFAGTIETEETSPGRRWFSLGDLSWNTWWVNDDRDVPAFDYYDGAAAMSLMLDLKIRHDTGGRRSLDDVMRYLFRDWEAKKENEFVSSGGTYGDGDLPRIIQAATGDAEAASLFTTWWDTTTLPDWNTYLGYAGLKLVKTPPKPDQAVLDATTTQIGAPDGVGYKPRAFKLGYGIPSLAPDQLMLSRIESGGAAQRAGLETYDALQSIDGALVTAESLPGMLALHRPGDVVAVGVIREGHVLSIPLTLGRAHLPTYAIEVDKRSSKAAAALRAGFEAGRPFST